ncbi:VOC family protein [Nocardiopsis flavescens]|uniref:VOC family protein n=1 Tax=Nocardiopsis flavescens TaxID=758803 RepID=UPI00364A420F
MALSLDTVTLAVPRAGEAEEFYTSVFSPAGRRGGDGDPVVLDLHGAGRIALREVGTEGPADAGTPEFRGHVLSYIVAQPGEVESLLAAAVAGGAHVLKPARKGVFGGFSAVLRAPEGTVWKLAAPTKKNTGPSGEPPVPTEAGALLGVADPTASKAFYTSLGLAVDRDYGDKYIDFAVRPGGLRLGLMTRRALAKDAGVGAGGPGPGSAVPTLGASKPEEVDAVLEAAQDGGGGVTAAGEVERGDGRSYTGRFTDPDGFPWEVAAAV